MGRALPHAPHTVRVECRVRAYDFEILRQALSNKTSVERIAMVKWQCFQRQQVFESKIQALNACPITGCLQKRSKRRMDAKLPQADLDRHFPDARHAKEEVERFPFNPLTRVSRKALVALGHPKECVRIKQAAVHM